MSWKYRLRTLGCKVNQYETQQVRELLESLGLRAANDDEPADLAVVNTCAVTASALRQSRQEVRKLVRDEGASVIVVGCGASADAARFQAIGGVAAVLGHDSAVREGICQALSRLQLCGRAPEADPRMGERPEAAGDGISVQGASTPTQPAPRGSFTRNLPATSAAIISPELPIVKTDPALMGRIDAFDGHQRAFLKVQDGCDAHCTYCIIPRLRPTLRFKAVEDAVKEAEGLVARGHREIVITGIFLGAYGRPTALRKRHADADSPLAELIRRLAGVNGLARLRLSSLEPGDVDDHLLEVIRASECCVPHLHLPLQSGADEVLRRMNRQYSRDDYLRMIDRVHRHLDRPAISTDIIVGFPGESDGDFEASVEIARAAEFVHVHAFPFSSREGTAAAKWRSRHVPQPVIRERMERLNDVAREASLSFRKRAVGSVERVLVEELDPAANVAAGRTDRYFKLHFDPRSSGTGDLVHVRVDRVTAGRSHGTRL